MEATCVVTGDGDLYGIGVRVGLYLQWLAGFLLRNRDGSWKTISSVRTANTAVSTALNLSVVINSVRGSSLSIDYPIVYYLTIALFYSESYNLMRKGTERPNEPGYKYTLNPDAALVAQNILFASATLFGTWFWLRGVFVTQWHGCDTPAKGALLGVFDLQDDRWRWFALSCSVIAGAAFVLILCIHAVSLVYTDYYNQPVGRTAVFAAVKLNLVSGGPMNITVKTNVKMRELLLRPRLAIAFKDGWTQSARSGFHWFVINLLGPLIAITSVERMLVANGVLTPAILESSGQMIALLTGIMSLCVALWDVGRPAIQGSSVDLLSSHMYVSRKPLSKEQMQEALIGLTKAVEQYDNRPVSPNRSSRPTDEPV